MPLWACKLYQGYIVFYWNMLTFFQWQQNQWNRKGEKWCFICFIEWRFLTFIRWFLGAIYNFKPPYALSGFLRWWLPKNHMFTFVKFERKQPHTIFEILKSPSLHSLHSKNKLGKFILNFTYKLKHVIH